MYLTQLATVARRTSARVVEVDGWKSRGHGGQTSVQTIVCHHTAGPRTGNYPSLAVVRDGRPGLAGPLAHYGIGRDGTIYVIAAGKCWHAGVVKAPSYANENAIGIEAENTGAGEPWPAALMASYRALCGELTREFRLSVSRVMGHKEVCAPVGRKTDPDFSMTAFRSSVTDYLRGDGMPLSDADVKKVVDELLSRRVTNAHTGETASVAAWLVYGNEKAGKARDNAAAAERAVGDVAGNVAAAASAASRSAVAEAIQAGIKVDISVNGAQQ